MINHEKLSDVIAAYREYFPTHWQDEKYKWEAVQHFQKNWDINAQNFTEMFMTATGKTYNLLANMNNYPRGMIKSFSKADPEAVRAMFILLYDETRSLNERIVRFYAMSEDLRLKYDDGTWKQHYQTMNAITTYLWLRYPDKYYIYKYSEVRSVAKELQSDFVPKKGATTGDVEECFKLYDEIRKEVIADHKLDELLKEALNEECYPDPEKNTMTIDLGFFISRFYNHDTEIDLESLHSEAKFSKWYAPLIDTLYNMGGGGRRPEVHRKMIEDYNITEEELQNLNSVGTPQILNDIDWARNYLVYEGFIDKSQNGIWRLTELGQSTLITDELASKLTAKWVKIKAAEREHRHVPKIDLSAYYTKREENNSIISYTKEDFLDEVYISEENYDSLIMLLRRKKNIILQGAPGVGKTFAARRLAYSMMGEKDNSRIGFVQFHQNYSYEDFIMGYKPKEQGYSLEEGIFYEFCDKAGNNKDKDFFFIIDEINRGNMSKIFGELLTLIEKDYRGAKATLAYKKEELFSVPENLYIIGMMNTADRSLAMIDYALRRRFSFFEMEPAFHSDGFKDYQTKLHNETFNDLIEQIVKLNKEIKEDDSLGEGFRIGHSYFCLEDSEDCTEEWMKSVVYYDIIPTLKEYWFDDSQKVREWENRLSGVFND